MKPSKLLQDLGVIGIPVKNALVRTLRTIEVFLLFMDMTDLEPDVFFSQGRWRRVDDVLEAFEALVVLLLLLVYDAQSKVDLVSLLEVGLHLHNLRKGLLGMVQRPVSIIQDAYSIPQLWFLGSKARLATV